MRRHYTFPITTFVILLSLLLAPAALALPAQAGLNSVSAAPLAGEPIDPACFLAMVPMTFRDAGAPATGGEKYNRPMADYNGDGCADLAIGAPLKDFVNGDDIGFVAVIYGSTTSWTQDEPKVKSLSQPQPNGMPNDWFGYTLAYGDFNSDGYSDLAVGIIGKTLGAADFAGQIRVYYGGPDGLSDAAFAVFDQFALIDFPENGDMFSRALAAGDFNGDGYDDLAVSATGETYQAVLAAGVVHIIFGSETGLTADGDLRIAQNDLETGDLGDSDRFGTALVSADFDGDGFDDLAIGTPLKDSLAIDDAGWVDVLYGSPTGPNLSNQYLYQAQFLGQTVEENELFGKALAAGDFDGDGYPDLAIGSPGETVDGHLYAGVSFVVYGSASGLTLSGAQKWDRPALPGANSMENMLGDALTTGDFDSDGDDELVIGVPGDADGAGSVHVLSGTPAGLTAAGSQVFSQGAGGIVGDAAPDDLFGYSLTAGDYDRDGFLDLAVGAPFEDLTPGILDSGEVYIIFGSFNGLTTAGNLRFYQDLPTLPGESEPADWFGLSIR